MIIDSSPTVKKERNFPLHVGIIRLVTFIACEHAIGS